MSDGGGPAGQRAVPAGRTADGRSTATLRRWSGTAASVDEPPRTRDLLAAEWIKQRSLRSTYVALVLGLALVLGSAVVSGRHLRLSPLGRATYDPLVMAFGTNVWGTLMFGAACLGAMTIASEYASGLIHATFVAVPDRRRVVSAKAGVVIALTGGFGVVVAPLSLGATRAVLAHADVHVPLSYPGTWQAVIVSALILPVCGLIGMAIGALVRHVASAIIAIVALQVLPAMFVKPSTSAGWLTHVSAAIPEHAWLALAGSSDTHHLALPGATTAWLVLAAWTLGSLVLAAVLVSRRET